ncbi:hypothetical protein SAMN04489761_4317 [Tenacibaculum sp. MAR_2009_124]|uniref:hypothetical protein n=1 Tax=Tenacibaculum sp. MAR_2009_124 TaxID=1250059 RepID=UPI00089B6229|nr:hypothetical protein [Tenacibaculum sp. MAR_2009_124]SED11388.1 hypothetical protein SAMN04489761_4317 [Tenacibaculum sp. MAR_2009_124]
MANITTNTEKTTFEKCTRGWSGETITTHNKQDYKITTMKRSNKKIVNSYHEITLLPNGSYSWDMFGAKGGDLVKIEGKATEKAIKEAHAKALLKFDEVIKELQPNAKAEPEIGTIIFLDGYGKTKGSAENEHIVYKIEHTEWGVKYLTVEKTTLDLQAQSYIKNYNNLFGIGSYFLPEYKYEGTQDDINNLVIAAHKKAEEDKKAAESERLLEQQLISAKIEEGKKLITIPEWAKAVIVADHYQNDSDTMTDYFATSIKETNYLAFSRTTRNNMNELKNACENWEKTKELLNDSETGEHRERNSYLPDFYIGSSNWYGLKVNKKVYSFDLTRTENRNKLYIAAAENRCHFPTDQPTQENHNLNSGDFQIIDYSEKAIAVIGDTKPIKDDLKKLGGRFNFRLSCGAGWIFPKTKQEEVK